MTPRPPKPRRTTTARATFDAAKSRAGAGRRAVWRAAGRRLSALYDRLPPALRDRLARFDSAAGAVLAPITKALLYLAAGTWLITALTGFLLPLPAGFWPGALGASPAGSLAGLRLWTPFTYILLHGGLGHLLGCAAVIALFGTRLERAWGATRYLRLLAGATLAGAAAHLVLAAAFRQTGVAIFGLNGIAYAVALACALAWPADTVTVGGVLAVKLRVLAGVLAGVALLGALGAAGGGAHFGHLAAAAAGWLAVRRPEVLEAIPVPRLGHRRYTPPARRGY